MKIKALILLACLTLTTGLPHQAVFAADTIDLLQKSFNG